MAKQHVSKFTNLNLGMLPAEALAKFGLNLIALPVRFSIAAQKHAHSRHPDNFEACLPHLLDIVSSPTYVGQGPEHKLKGFELVLDVRQGDFIMLLALHLKPINGTYIVKSVYPINVDTLDRRLRKGFLTKA